MIATLPKSAPAMFALSRVDSRHLRFISTKSQKILITGCHGQLGTGLMNILRDNHRVIGTDVKTNNDILLPGVTYDYCDVTDAKMVEAIVSKHRPSTIIHFSAILSGAGEKDPDLAQQVNVNGFLNILNCARKHKLRLFSPSTIAAFGPSTPRKKTPDITVMRPTSIYGVTKVFMELMGEYYHQKYGVDFRSLRLPGIISPRPIHGMGTTDYAVEMFFKAINNEAYKCYLQKNSRLPMVYISDCLDGIVKIINSPAHKLKKRVYNINALDLTPLELETEIGKQLKSPIKVSYASDFRQVIADSWPASLDDKTARKDWGWKPRINTIQKLVSEMLQNLKPSPGSRTG